MDKLKPCPFCGSSKLISWQTGDGWEIKCRYLVSKGKKGDVEARGCGARIITFIPEKFPKGTKTLEELYDIVKQECIDKWNRRV